MVIEIVSFLIQNGGFFHRFFYVYQRINRGCRQVIYGCWIMGRLFDGHWGTLEPLSQAQHRSRAKCERQPAKKPSKRWGFTILPILTWCRFVWTCLNHLEHPWIIFDRICAVSDRFPKTFHTGQSIQAIHTNSCQLVPKDFPFLGCPHIVFVIVL